MSSDNNDREAKAKAFAWRAIAAQSGWELSSS